MYLPELTHFTKRGFECSTINTDELSDTNPIPDIQVDDSVLYRGWMLTGSEYQHLVGLIQSAGSVPIKPPEAYVLTHHIPNWYPLISDLTPETVVLPFESDFESELRALEWKSFFIKDYVKSLKTSMGSIIDEPSQIDALLEEMEKFRGTIEGGLCIRKVEPLDAATETRYFVIDGKPHGNTNQPVPFPVRECAERIASPFFSVDLAKRSDGVERVVEIGDGQVSDLVGWQIDKFVDLWGTHT